MSDISHPDRPEIVIDTLTTGQLVSWPAIFAGGVVAVASSMILTAFGTSVGLTMWSPFQSDSLSGETIGIATLAWFAFVHIYSVAMGAYLSGRMRPRVQVTDRGEIHFRDGLNGFVVWALAVAFTGYIAVQAAGTAATGLAQAANSTGATLSAAASNPAVDSAVSTVLDDIVAGVNRADNGEQQPAAAQSNQTNESNQTNNQPTTSQANNSQDVLQAAARLTPDDRRAITSAIAARMADGEFSDQDVQAVSNIISARTGIASDQLRQRVQEVSARAVETAKQTTEEIRQVAALAGFWTAFILLISGAMAWLAGAIGGSHRDIV